MGQGSYTFIGYGVLNGIEEENILDEFYESDIFIDFNIRVPGESSYNHICVPLAVSDGVLQDTWNVPDLPEGKLSDIESYIKGIKQAKSKWAKVHKWFKMKGVDLPEAQLIILNDYD